MPDEGRGGSRRPLTLFGLMGFPTRCYDFPIAPAVVGMILGPVAESQLRRARDQPRRSDVRLRSPISATLLAIATIALIAPFVGKELRRLTADDN